MNKDSAYWISKLNLQKHPEGGYFFESYKSVELVNLPKYHGSRHISTAIYYLLEGDEFSAFHVMKSDELWHFYAGSSLTLFIIEPNGRLNEVILGENIDNGHTFQAAITAGCWFAAAVDDYNSYSLVGCTVSPGFDYQDWKIGDMKILTKLYPQHKSIIEKYTK